MVIGSGRGDVVSCFFGEDLGEVSVFGWERDFGFRFLGGDGEFYFHCEFGNEQGVREEAYTIATEDPVDLVIVQEVLEVLALHVVVKIVIKSRVIDSIYVDMAMGLGKGFSKEGVMPLGICSMAGVKFFQLVTGFWDD